MSRLTFSAAIVLIAASSAFGADAPLDPPDPPRGGERIPDDENLPTRDRPATGGREVGDRNKGLGLPPAWWPIEPTKSPGWTQDRDWLRSRFWRLDQGEMQLEYWWRAETVRRRAGAPRGTDHLFQIELAMGILPGIQLDVYENFEKTRDTDKVDQEGNQIEMRIAPFEYGKVPLNPTLYLEWHPRHGEPDKLEMRLLLGGSPFDRFMIAVNGISEWETGGDHSLEWGFSAAASYEVIPEVFRLGVETEVTWTFLQHENQYPTHDLSAEAGPNLIVRPLALVDKEWGKHFRVTYSLLFGLTKDSVALDSVFNVQIGF
jgi:hypothetical protein